jgi:hypothetical protein
LKIKKLKSLNFIFYFIPGFLELGIQFAMIKRWKEEVIGIIEFRERR